MKREGEGERGVGWKWVGRGGVGREPAPAVDFLSLGAADPARPAPIAIQHSAAAKPPAARAVHLPECPPMAWDNPAWPWRRVLARPSHAHLPSLGM